MDNVSSLITITFGIIILIINIILVINIMKAGKYSELTYELIRSHINKLNEKENRQNKEEIEKKNFNKSIHDVWNEIQNENENK
ncbi:MAG: hypothetical protein LW701_00235 [Fluviicola sp.]|jgi:hypothetical protein|nr:hypothetical protein [Fluviicola sp.]